MKKNQKTNNETQNERSSANRASRSETRRERKERRLSWKHQLLRLPLILLIPLGLMLPKLVQNSPEKVESIYSRSIYPVISRIAGWVSSLIPVSLAEVLIFAGAAFIAFIVVFRLIAIFAGKFKNRKLNRLKFFRTVISVAIFAGVLLNLFYIMWGFNYYRLTAAKLLDLKVQNRPKEDLAMLCGILTDQAIELREMVDEDENGVFTFGDERKAFKRVCEAYKELGKQNELFSNAVYPAKTIIASVPASMVDIAGIYIPFTEEANVNHEQPDLFMLAGAAHETAHYFGFAREDEANFFAYYACMCSSDPSVRYSAAMHALNYCAEQLYSTDKDLYFEIRGRYSDGMNRDLADYSVYYKKYENKPAQKAGNDINDSYLKFNGQDDGIKSYGRMVDLLLAYLLPING